MRFVKVLASIIFGLIIILAIGGYFFVRDFDLNKYKVYAEEMAENALGRKLKINGDASIGISLIPTVIVNDVELANPSWAQNPQMAKVKQAEVKFAILPLLKKQIVIDKVHISEPEIYLEKSAQGAVSWDFDKLKEAAAVTPAAVKKVVSEPTAKASGAALAAGFVARNVVIENGVVQYFDAQTKSRADLQIGHIGLNMPGYDEQISLDFDVTYNQQPISGEGEFGSLAQLLGKTENFPVLLTVKALGISADINGSVADMTEAPRYAALVNLYNPAGNLNAPETTLKTRIDGDVNGADAQVEVLNIVNNLITGSVSAKWNGKVPQVDANLQSAKISLPSLSSSSNFAFEMPALIAEAQALEMVPNTQIPYQLLNMVNANLNLQVKQLILTPEMTAQNVKMVAQLKGGNLNVKPLELDFGGGKINAALSVNAAQKSLTFKANSQNLQLQSLHKEFVVENNTDFGVKSGGQVEFDINVSGSGATYRKLAESLKGQVIGIVSPSVVQTGALKFISGNFISQLLSALKINLSQSTDIDLTCAVVRADLGGGKATLPKGIAIDAKQLTLVSDGRINLVNDNISFTLEPSMNQLASGNITQALASFIKIGGTLQDPKIMLDNKETLKTLVGVAATGGVAYLGSQVLLNGSGAPCYVALEGTPYASRFPKPTGVKATTQNVYDGTAKQIKAGVKDLKNTAKDILGIFKTPKK